jgi:hypothetical protein
MHMAHRTEISLAETWLWNLPGRYLKRIVLTVASRPRFGGDSQALSWYRPAEMRPSWVGTSWKGSAGQGPAIPDETGTRPKEFPYVYKIRSFPGRIARQ